MPTCPPPPLPPRCCPPVLVRCAGRAAPEGMWVWAEERRGQRGGAGCVACSRAPSVGGRAPSLPGAEGLVEGGSTRSGS